MSRSPASSSQPPLKTGIAALRRVPRLLWAYWFYTTAFALAAAVPVWLLLARQLDRSLYAAELARSFDPQWFAEFALVTRGWPAAMLGGMALVLGAGYLLLSTFLAGGALSIFARGHVYHAASFYSACARHFGRLFRLLLIALVCYGALASLNAGLQVASRKLLAGSMVQLPVLLFSWSRVALVVLLFCLLNMIFDYAKIHLVVEDRRGAMSATLAALRLARGNFRRMGALYAAITLLALALLGAYRALAWLPLSLLLQQAYVLGRIATRLLYFAAQTGLYQDLSSPAAAATGTRYDALVIEP